MKIRKLIFSAKLEQIENMNQNIFIFHCSANAAQWRFLKNFLFNQVGNFKTNSAFLSELPRKASEGGLPFANSNGLAATNLNPNMFELNGTKNKSQKKSKLFYSDLGFKQHSKNEFHVLTLFQSTSLKKKLVLANLKQKALNTGSFASSLVQQSQSHPIGSIDKVTDTSVALLTDIVNCGVHSSKSMHNEFRPKGCLFFFDTRSQKLFDSLKKNSICLEIVNQIESLKFNKNFILLNGQIQSTVVNHIDIKETLKLDVQTTYEEFFISMRLVSLTLDFCLNQKIDEFFCAQEWRKKSKTPAKNLCGNLSLVKQ